MECNATQCQFCWRIRDENSGPGASPLWADLPAFIQKHELESHDLSFSEGYCPECDRFYCQLTQSVCA